VVSGEADALRIAFFGTPAFAVPTLTRLIESRHRVVGVVTQPDRPRGRGQQVSYAPVKALAVARGVPVLQPDRLKQEIFGDAFAALDADLGVVAAYGKILPQWLLEAPRLGMVNVHASLLPKYRGAAPVHRAVVNGEIETGVTIMRVVRSLDAGPMLARQVRPIDLYDTSDAVERDLAVIGADLLADSLEDLAAGRLVEVPQDEAAATYAHRLSKDEGLIDFRLSALAIHNRVRGLRPWPGAYTFLRGKRVAFHRTRPSEVEMSDAAPGLCVTPDLATMTVICGDGRAIDVLELQPEGKRAMSARDFLAGHPGLSGHVFG
jgi:methionyl-tRNA formyltransferase